MNCPKCGRHLFANQVQCPCGADLRGPVGLSHPLPRPSKNKASTKTALQHIKQIRQRLAGDGKNVSG